MDDQIIKMAIVQTVIDTIELLVYLRGESSNVHYKQIDEMILRLTTMVQAIK